MRWAHALSAVLFVLALAALPAADAPAKGKRVTCKGSKVPVTAGKKTTCKPLNAVVPKPQGVDIRLAYLREGVAFDSRRLGAAGRRARAKISKALPKALALIDRSQRRSARSLFSGPTAYASACGANGEASPAGSTDGVGLVAYGDNGGQMQFSTSGLTFRTRFASCSKGTGFNVPDCPPASGEVKATGATDSFEITEEVLDGERVVWRKNTNFETKRKGNGQVAADAKLDYIVVEASVETFVVASGGIVHRGTTTRHARVNMRTGKYDPGDVRVTVRGDAKASDGANAFASIADTAIRAFRYAESGGFGQEGWATFNRKSGPYCAEPVFSPASETLKLRKGKSGQLGIYAKARADGGKAAAARWTLVAPLNASFAPSSVEGVEPSVSYTVTNAPKGGKVQVTVRFTSTAGVGEKTWTQPTEPEEAINRIEGTFGGELSAGTLLGIPSVQKWSGVAVFDRISPADGGGADGIYLLSSGNVSVQLSGIEQSGSTSCFQSGSAMAPLTTGMMIVTGTGPEKGPPYSYEITPTMPFAVVEATRHTCPKAAQEAGFEGTKFPIGAAWKLDVKGARSADGLGYLGSQEESFGIPPFVTSFAENWTLHGKP